MRKKEIKFKNVLVIPSYFPFEIGWKDLNIAEFDIMDKIFKFLEKNFIEDSDSTFRFNYIHEFLYFSIKIPGWRSFFNLGVSFLRGKKLLGLIIATPKSIIYNNYFIQSTEINYLCLLKKFRCKHFVAFLIQEITRRLNFYGINQAIFTTSVKFLKSLTKTFYFHYAINIQKLIKFEFIKSKNCIITSQIIRKNLKNVIRLKQIIISINNIPKTI
jgi:glycylpeptide N-tetradecanoyltransferase